MDQSNLKEEFRERIKKKEERKQRGEREKKSRALWYGIGMFGVVGWAVVIPTLLFLAIGIYLDTKIEDKISWTLIFLFVGVVTGCLNAWYWVKRESRNE
ncbi:ATP synthase subunit [candidate division KSB1 bacterium]|nr:ATP synthase subunit [candidate division KSB1 bacterium]